MSTALRREGNTLRTRLTEPQWAGVCAGFGEPGVGPGGTDHPLGPLTAATGEPADPDVLDAARLALGATAVIVDVTTAEGDRGVVSRLGSDLTAAAAVTRVLGPPPDGDSQAALVPGVEVCLTRAENLTAEITRLVPPDRRTVEPPQPARWKLPHEFALVWSRAVRDGDDALVAEIAATCGWDEPPPELVAAAEHLEASVAVAVRVAGSDKAVLLRWVRTERGWLRLIPTRDSIVHEPCTRAGIVDTLVDTLAGAFGAEAVAGR